MPNRIVSNLTVNRIESNRFLFWRIAHHYCLPRPRYLWLNTNHGQNVHKNSVFTVPIHGHIVFINIISTRAFYSVNNQLLSQKLTAKLNKKWQTAKTKFSLPHDFQKWQIGLIWHYKLPVSNSYSSSLQIKSSAVVVYGRYDGCITVCQVRVLNSVYVATVKPPIEAHQYNKLLWPPACIRDPASIRTCQNRQFPAYFL